MKINASFHSRNREFYIKQRYCLKYLHKTAFRLYTPSRQRADIKDLCGHNGKPVKLLSPPIRKEYLRIKKLHWKDSLCYNVIGQKPNIVWRKPISTLVRTYPLLKIVPWNVNCPWDFLLEQEYPRSWLQKLTVHRNWLLFNNIGYCFKKLPVHGTFLL